VLLSRVEDLLGILERYSTVTLCAVMALMHVSKMCSLFCSVLQRGQSGEGSC